MSQASVKLVVCLRGTGSADDIRRTTEALRRHSDRTASVITSEAPDNDLVWKAVDAEPDADVVLVQVGAVVGPGWQTQMRDAAYRESLIATASAMPVHGERPDVPRVDAVKDAASLGAPVWGCVYIRRDALNIAASTGWCPGAGARRSEVALEDVTLVPGFVHVLAPVTVTLPAKERSGRSPLPDVPATRRLAAEIESAAAPLRVTIDLRCCAYPVSGTQVHALNLVSALAARDDVELGVLVPAYPHKSSESHLASLPAAVTRHPEGRPIRPPPHVFHRPYQVFERHINDVVTPGARAVITHQDLILDRTPAYFRSRDRWRNYVAATALSLVAADEVAFFSEHARREAVADGLVDESKTSVVPPGTDHLDGRCAETAPAAIASHSQPFILFVGNAYFHKNRLFSLRLTQELLAKHGWDGAFVSAGGRPPHGSSERLERSYLREHDELRRRFVDLGRVTDAELQWLYSHAAVVLFPTLYEGFGLVPFEAAAAGTPCVYSSRSSVAEYLPADGALVELDAPTATAAHVAGVLEDGTLRSRIVDAIRARARSLTWSSTADSYVDIYRRALTRPVGLSLVFGEEVRIGAPSQMATTEAERQVLRILKRSAAVRTVAETVLGWLIDVRRALRRS